MEISNLNQAKFIAGAFFWPAAAMDQRKFQSLSLACRVAKFFFCFEFHIDWHRQKQINFKESFFLCQSRSEEKRERKKRKRTKMFSINSKKEIGRGRKTNFWKRKRKMIRKKLQKGHKKSPKLFRDENLFGVVKD